MSEHECPGLSDAYGDEFVQPCMKNMKKKCPHLRENKSKRFDV